MKKGSKKEVRIDAKIDLHGYTLQDAYGAFCDFVELCVQEESVAVILVVTGKGPPELDAPQTSINYEFKHWCDSRPLASYIKSVSQAAERHGGKGAFYVRLRK